MKILIFSVIIFVLITFASKCLINLIYVTFTRILIDLNHFLNKPNTTLLPSWCPLSLVHFIGKKRPLFWFYWNVCIWRRES